MSQMRNIRDGLKCDFGAIKGATAGSGSGSKQPVTALLSLATRLGLVCGATGFVQNLLKF
jgi:hypothetical protein